MAFISQIKRKQTTVFGILFIFLTIIGTVTHELGHYAVAKNFNFTTTLHYGSVSYEKNNTSETRDDLSKQKLLIAIGGPLETIATGFLGLAILYIRRKKRSLNSLSTIDWIAVFLSLFWVRQCYGFTITLFKSIINQNIFLGGDEARINKMLHLYPGVIHCRLGIMSIGICYYVIFIIVPRENRHNLLLGGFIGSLSGFLLWFKIIGEIILP